MFPLISLERSPTPAKTMTQPAPLEHTLPDFGSPFGYRDQDPNGKKAPYSLETPYGFLLDLDFLKYVDDIERGQTLRKLPLQRKAKGTKPGLGSSCGQRGGWTSTESLSSTASEDGRGACSPRTKLWASSSEIREPPSRDASLPLSPVLPLLPPPSPKRLARNPRVEKTLWETSQRLTEEQLSLPTGAAPQVPASPSKVGPGDPSAPRKTSPSNSGSSTPAAIAAALSPASLHHVREQMVATLKQLKELEEQVKIIPALEEQIRTLKEEKEELISGMRDTLESDGGEARIFRFPSKLPKVGTDGTEEGISLDSCEEHAKAGSLEGPPKPRESKIEGLKKLTERLERGGKTGKGSARSPKAEEPSHCSVGVGEEVDMNDAVFYYRCQRPCCDVAVGRELETHDAETWVMESLLGVSPEAEEELRLLQQTIQHQREVIAMLEGHLKEATDELEALRVEVCSRVLHKETAEACVEAVPVTRCQAVGSHVETVDRGILCSPHVACVGVGCNLQQRSEKATQIDKESRASRSGAAAESDQKSVDGGGKIATSVGWKSTKEPPGMEISGLHQEPILLEPPGKDGEATIVLQKETENSSERSTGTGALKSIMKKQNSPAKAEGASGRKTLQFVGELNGEYESTSSEEEEEEEEAEEEEEGTNQAPLSSETDTDGSTDSSDGEFASDRHPDSSSPDGRESGHNPEEVEGGRSPSREAEPTVKEKFELSPRMREACLVLKSHLGRGGATPKSKEGLSGTGLILQEWFRVSSQKASLAAEVADHLLAFAEISPALLAHVVNLSDGNGNTALHYSVSHSNFDIVRLLLDTGVCNVDHQNKAGYTALMLAALASVEEEADMAAVQRLFSMGEVNARASQAGQTALMLAVSHGRQEMVEALLACGADLNLQDEEGSTALMCACEHGRAGTVRLLLSEPACDVCVVDHDGKDAVSIALEAGHRDIAALISTRLTQVVAQPSDQNGKPLCKDQRQL